MPMYYIVCCDLLSRTVVRRRRNHEYKLVRRPARKEDYLTAIQYEVHLDMLRKHRKKVGTV